MPVFDQPTAALLTDLKQRGLMEDTLVLWTTEFGRMPTRQNGTVGRDHNPDGFTLWMMGGGVKGGTSYGATDDFGRRAQENPTTIWEFYSTVLHILGLDYNQLSWYHNGLDRRLTDVHGHVMQDVLVYWRIEILEGVGFSIEKSSTGFQPVSAANRRDACSTF